MYHLIVRRKLLRAFDAINRGEYAGIVAQFAPRHRHVMHGAHALGGERHSLARTAQWYARLQRLLPDLRFTVHSVVVAGWPWDTRASVGWTDGFTLPDGSRGSNQGVHEFTLRWGRVHALSVHCDTARLQAYCQRMCASGLAEAAAPPIVEDAEQVSPGTATQPA